MLAGLTSVLAPNFRLLAKIWTKQWKRLNRTREFSDEDIAKVASTYHEWRNKDGKYEDEPGFCASVNLKKVRELDYVLSPGRYVGLPEEEGDFVFSEKFPELQKEFENQLKEETKLNKRILDNLSKIDYEK